MVLIYRSSRTSPKRSQQLRQGPPRLTNAGIRRRIAVEHEDHSAPPPIDQIQIGRRSRLFHSHSVLQFPFADLSPEAPATADRDHKQFSYRAQRKRLKRKSRLLGLDDYNWCSVISEMLPNARREK